MIERVRRQTGKPVSTAEPWHVWVENPDLGKSVDFIAIHILPYWEGIEVRTALSESFARIDEIRARFPEKPLLISEVGWPSHGGRYGAAIASPENQAWFIA
jgi:exo-beta-1,3-glucanase (GH17 family)